MYQTQYEEELEINDFPQSCRWKVTSREAIGNITDFSEADIQIRGVYYPPGKEPGEGMFKSITSHPFKTCQSTINYNNPIWANFDAQGKLHLDQGFGGGGN